MIKNSTLKTHIITQINYNNHGDSMTYNNWNRSFYFDSLQINKLRLKINQLLENNNTLSSSDLIYTNSSSDIPRFKLKEFMIEKGINRTSRIEQSTCILLSKKLLQELKGMKKLFDDKEIIYFVSEEVASMLYNGWNNDKNYYSKPKKPSSSMNKWLYLPEYNLKPSTKNHANLTNSKKYGKYVPTHFTKEEVYMIDHRSKKWVDLLDTVNFLYENPNIKVVFDEDLFKDLNKEGMVLDSDIESTLKDMIYSKDKDNIKLGLELISNLEVNDHTLYKMSLLLNNFINMGGDRLNRSNRAQITQLSMNNRNLKTLLNTFKTKEIYWDRDWKTFASGLIKNFRGTEHEILIKEYFIDKLNNEFASLSGVKIEDIKFA
jgi:hypothetical protein